MIQSSDFLLMVSIITLLQLTLSASDRGIPPKSSSNRFTLSIDVLRNTYCPQFENLPATTTIKKTSTGYIYGVTALDSDISVSTFAIYP